MLLGFPIMHVLVEYGIGFLILAMLVRAIASWFRIDERFAIIRFLAYITDPFIKPVQRIMRSGSSTMVFDLSYFIVFFLLSTFSILLTQALPAGW